MKKASLKELRKNFYYKEILQLIDVSKNNSINREEIVTKALEEGDISEGPISADQALRRVEKKLGVIWSLPEGYTIDGLLPIFLRKVKFFWVWLSQLIQSNSVTLSMDMCI